jgi:hypothetical protein
MGALLAKYRVEDGDYGYWDIPGDVRGHWKITGDIGGAPMMVWIWCNDDNCYLLPFANTRPYADQDGKHYGVHPCGGYEVDRVVIDEIMERGK